MGCSPRPSNRDRTFNVADVVFDENFFYCRVEPELFAHSCGPGDPAQSDAANGCHFNVTSFRLSDYAPLVADSLQRRRRAERVGRRAQARQNYQVSQARMDRDPERARLFSGRSSARHPSAKIFEPDSPTADVIRDWATKFSTQ